jgi:isocitrate dehydrogenase (NAD+)
MRTPVTLIPGDGAGPELVAAAVLSVEASGAQVEWRPAQAGLAAARSTGTPLPRETVESVRRTQFALAGPMQSVPGERDRAVFVALRKELGLFANVRPARSVEGISTRFPGVDLIVVRENTEGMYSGVEHFVDEARSSAESISIITRKGSERIVEYAFRLAQEQGRRSVTLVHKANVLRCTSGLFLEAGREVARRFPAIEFRDEIVDHCAMALAQDPTRFDVIVTTNLFGDILSDLAIGLVGGAALAVGASVGQSAAVFEAVHGADLSPESPQGANPTPLLLAAAMLLRHAGQPEPASRIERAVRSAIAARDELTADLGGSATAHAYAQAVVRRMS